MNTSPFSPPGGRPSVSQFQSYLPWFLGARPSEGCAKGGVGAYSSALQRADPDDPTSVAGLLPEAGWREGGWGEKAGWGEEEEEQDEQEEGQEEGQEEEAGATAADLAARLRRRRQLLKQRRGGGAATTTISADGGGKSGGKSGGGGGGKSGGGGGGRVAASSFRTYYRPLSRQSDFIEAMRQVRVWGGVGWGGVGGGGRAGRRCG